MIIARLTALAGTILTVVQMILLSGDGKGICLNNGCEIVDSLTVVPPLFFNIGGFLFFQIVFWGLWMARKEKRFLVFVKAVLLAALAAEAVLLFFQHAIAQTFCSYCLIIFSFIVILTFCCGVKHVWSGASVFLAVILAMSALQFSTGSSITVNDLDNGTIAVISENREEQKHYLFFSSNCKYCEKVKEFIASNECSVRFNPIEILTDFSFQDAVLEKEYNSEINREFLAGLGIEQIPVLVSVVHSGFSVVTGEQAIKEQLKDSCNSISIQEVPPLEFTPGGTLKFLPPALDDSCTMNSDCDDPLNPSKVKAY